MGNAQRGQKGIDAEPVTSRPSAHMQQFPHSVALLIMLNRHTKEEKGRSVSGDEGTRVRAPHPLTPPCVKGICRDKEAQRSPLSPQGLVHVDPG